MKCNSIKRVADGVVEYEFAVHVAGEYVPALLWTPAQGIAPRALLAMGHGGSQHKRSETIVNRAIRYAQAFAWATLALDAPQHGDRISAEEAERARAKTLARISGDPNAPALGVAEKIAYLDDLAAQAVPEWQAAIDAVFSTTLINAGIPMGYWGVSQGSSIGIPLLAVDKRFCCAVLGLAQLHPAHTKFKAAAQAITIPLRFAFQWDDAIRERAYGLALFDAFGSQEKSLHVNPGGHREIPAAEAASWDLFFTDHLPSAMG